MSDVHITVEIPLQTIVTDLMGRRASDIAEFMELLSKGLAKKSDNTPYAGGISLADDVGRKMDDETVKILRRLVEKGPYELETGRRYRGL